MLVSVLVLGCATFPADSSAADTGPRPDAGVLADRTVTEWQGRFVAVSTLIGSPDLVVHCIEGDSEWRCSADDPLAARRAYATPMCTLYKDAGFTGSSVTFTSGKDYNQLSELGLGDNVSSVSCSGGGQVSLYKDVNFGGSSTGFFTSDSYLPSPKNFNDVATAAYFSW